MSELIKEFEELSWFKKLLLAAICPIAWNLYRIAKSVESKNTGNVVMAAVFTAFSLPVWIFDIVFIMIKKQIWWKLDWQK